MISPIICHFYRMGCPQDLCSLLGLWDIAHGNNTSNIDICMPRLSFAISIIAFIDALPLSR